MRWREKRGGERGRYKKGEKDKERERVGETGRVINADKGEKKREGVRIMKKEKVRKENLREKREMQREER